MFWEPVRSPVLMRRVPLTVTLLPDPAAGRPVEMLVFPCCRVPEIAPPCWLLSAVPLRRTLIRRLRWGVSSCSSNSLILLIAPASALTTSELR